MPLVLEGMYAEYADVHQVTFDFVQGMRDALTFLQQQGHTHIGLVYHGVSVWPRVFQQLARELALRPAMMAFADPKRTTWPACSSRSGSGAHRPTALLLSSLPLAIEFDRYRWQHRLSIPRIWAW